MDETITEETLIQQLRHEVTDAGGIKYWADAKRVSASLTCAVLNSRAPLRGTIARALGYDTTWTFTKRPDKASEREETHR